MLRSFLSPTKRLSHYCSQEGCRQYDWTATTGAPLHGIIVPCLPATNTQPHTNSRYIIMLADFMILLPVFHTLPGHSFPPPVAERRLHYCTECFVLCDGDEKQGDETDSARDWPESSCTFIYRPFFCSLWCVCMCVWWIVCIVFHRRRTVKPSFRMI